MSIAQDNQRSTPPYKITFLQSCLSANVLTFGSFKLKSGRQSPYFFNAGSFYPGHLLSSFAVAYAHTIIDFLSSNPTIPRPDVLFGPAYKGIPIACCALLELARIDCNAWGSVGYSFNRKEAKDHGEGGAIVGAGLRGANVLVLDDVITAGTAMRETIELVKREGGTVVGFVVALDRMEKMPAPTADDDFLPRPSAMGQIRKEYGLLTASIVTLDDLIGLLKTKGNERDMKRMDEYRNRYLASD